MVSIREPAVAGVFYPADPDQLIQMVDGLLSEMTYPAAPPKALIAPHAGYNYSGPIAATVYASLRIARETIRRVVLIGPSHRVAFRGLAASSAEAFLTPLGAVKVDRASIHRLIQLQFATLRDDAHLEEHGLEVHLPFLQRMINDFSIVPLVFGDVSYIRIAEVLSETWGGPETLIVISSDLSHYYPYDQARELDHEAAQSILRLDPEAIRPGQACGRVGIQALLKIAREKELHATLLDLRNSGDTSSNQDKVVGYGAFSFD